MDTFEVATTALVVVGIVTGVISLGFILYLMFEEPIRKIFRSKKD